MQLSDVETALVAPAIIVGHIDAEIVLRVDIHVTIELDAFRGGNSFKILFIVKLYIKLC